MGGSDLDETSSPQEIDDLVGVDHREAVVVTLVSAAESLVVGV